jgi:Lipocalin-like domain
MKSQFLSLSAIVLGLASLPSNAVAQQSLHDQLVGAWTLLSLENILPDGKREQPYGAHPMGVLMFHPSGRYTVVYGRTGRSKLSSERVDVAAAELGEAARSFGANLGTWSVDESEKTVVRKYQMALIPNNEANEIKSAVTLDGDNLKLVITRATGKNETMYRRVY